MFKENSLICVVDPEGTFLVKSLLETATDKKTIVICSKENEAYYLDYDRYYDIMSEAFINMRIVVDCKTVKTKALANLFANHRHYGCDLIYRTDDIPAMKENIDYFFLKNHRDSYRNYYNLLCGNMFSTFGNLADTFSKYDEYIAIDYEKLHCYSHKFDCPKNEIRSLTEIIRSYFPL